MKTEAEFLHKALHSYENRQCNTVDEFNSDLSRIVLIRKILLRYQQTGEITTRLVLNHIIILFNVFGDVALDLILYKFDGNMHDLLFPFLDQQKRLPPLMKNVMFDEGIVKELENL